MKSTAADEQAINFALSLVRGKPNRERTVLTVLAMKFSGASWGESAKGNKASEHFIRLMCGQDVMIPSTECRGGS